KLQVFTNAISLGFWVEESVYNYFLEHQHDLLCGANSWENWAQRQVARWNQMFENAVFPETPKGVLDRIRIDKIVLVPDSTLPLGAGLPTNSPDSRDRYVDLQWGFPASLLNGSMYANTTVKTDVNAFYYEGSLLHEIGHARYLIDVYGFNVHDNGKGNTIGINENDVAIIGTPLMPFVSEDALYYTPMQGLMNSRYTYIDRYSAVALNLIAGNRATLGNSNAPGNIGAFLNDLPLDNCLTVRDTAGNPLPNADIKIFRAQPQQGVWYGKFFELPAELTLTTDTAGKVFLGQCPFDEFGAISHGNGFSNGTIIIRVEYKGGVGYGFLDLTEFNLEYWRGNKTLGNYELKFKLIQIYSGIENQLLIRPQGIKDFSISPNPANGNICFNFELFEPNRISLNIFSLEGINVTEITDTYYPTGKYKINFNAFNLNNGIYLCKLQCGATVYTYKLIMLK
ncbi:MAG: T9SS type A sorting domain-containing protein, partial [Bacteroidota bacterium]